MPVNRGSTHTDPACDRAKRNVIRILFSQGIEAFGNKRSAQVSMMVAAVTLINVDAVTIFIHVVTVNIFCIAHNAFVKVDEKSLSAPLQNTENSMSETTREKLLKLMMILTGITSILMIPIGEVWPSGFVWHGGEGEYYFQMIGGIYATLGAFLIYAARNPSAPQHQTFIWFAILVNIVHSVIMGIQAAGDPSEYGHLVGDVPILFISSVVIWYLLPTKHSATA